MAGDWYMGAKSEGTNAPEKALKLEDGETRTVNFTISTGTPPTMVQFRHR
jgi:hypothetical protein